jgi:hypothetical protein
MKQDVLQEARKLVELGWAVMPCYYKTKIPLEKGYNKKPFPTEAELEECFGGDKRWNFAVRLGRISNIGAKAGLGNLYLHDLDAECDEAVGLILKHSPGLANGPRMRSSKGGHFPFISAEIYRNIRLVDSEGKLKLELLGEGNRMMCPPSVHPKIGRAHV